MRPRSEAGDGLYAEVLRLGEDKHAARRFLAEHPLGEPEMIALLRRPVPRAFLEHVASSPPWSERPRILGVIVQNPKTPRVLGQRLLPYLFWRDLSEVAVSPRVEGGVRARAEGLLMDLVQDLRLGDKITLARIAPRRVLRVILREPDPRVLGAALQNPRLTEADLVVALQAATAPLPLLAAASASTRWRESYAVRLTLALSPKTPLALALAQITSLLPRDLLRVARTPGVPTLVQAAAERVAQKPRRR